MGTKFFSGARAAMLAGGLILTSAGLADAATLFVSATAKAGGNGSEKSPFNSLAAVQNASAPGDEIVVLPSPASAPPLDGGITLKPHQKLTGRGASVADPSATITSAARIANTSAAANSGDAIVLADGAEVSNLMIVNSDRGGIYGQNVTDVKVHDNNITGTNSSCTAGFIVIFPGQQPLLPNGWAAIMFDQDKGYAQIAVSGNYIHDGACNDGIDIRATGSGTVLGRVHSNTIARLAEGPKMRSLLAFGLQTRDRGIVTVDSDHNALSYIGSGTADCEGFFGNQSGGAITWNIEYSSFIHGIGGQSCNGGEFFLSNGPSTMNLYIGHSSFEDNPGDMIEEVNESDDAAVNMVLKDVTIKHTTKPYPTEPKFSPNGHGSDVNQARCINQGSHGKRSVNNLHVYDSHFSDCAGDVIGAVINSNGPETKPDDGGDGNSLSMDIENTVMDGSPSYALHFQNQSKMDELSVHIKNSVFSGAKGNAAIAFDTRGTEQRVNFDIDQGNCFLAGAGAALEVTGYKLNARNNWWGHAGGPSPSEVSVTNGSADTASPLGAAPLICQKAQ